MLPSIAVIPFAVRGTEPEHQLLGEILADEIIAALSRTSELHVISRLSTTVFRDRNSSLLDVSAHLNASYVLYGAYRTIGTRVALEAELAEAKSGRIVWSKIIKGQVAGILSGEDPLIDRVVAETGAAVLARELQRAQSLALPTLESYTLLLGAIALMHRLSLHDFDRARQMLQTLIDRAPRQAVPYAWLAKWHVLRVQQGWTEDPKAEARLALECTRRSLDADPTGSLALTIDGLVHTNLLKKLDVAQEKYEAALRTNPNDSLAWLLKGTLHAFRDEGKEAVRHTRHALKLSPLDPLKYYFDSLAATAALSAGQYQRALQLAERSMRLNRTHTSTLRAMITALWHLERQNEARAVAADLMRIDPSFRVSAYLERSPTGPYALGKSVASALQGAGIPA